MIAQPIQKLNLESLADSVPALTTSLAGVYKEGCIICFDDQGHASGVILKAQYRTSNEAFEVCWSGQVTDKMRRAYGGDRRRATEYGAYAIALLLVQELTNYTAFQQASIGTTIDYHLTDRNLGSNADLIFNHTARLEVSGILKESEGNTVAGRIRGKLKRLKADRGLPALIAIVEFSKPWSRMVEA